MREQQTIFSKRDDTIMMLKREFPNDFTDAMVEKITQLIALIEDRDMYNPISARELAGILICSERQVRFLREHAEAIIPIGSCHKGYFRIHRLRDLHAQMRWHRGMAQGHQSVIERLSRFEDVIKKDERAQHDAR